MEQSWWYVLFRNFFLDTFAKGKNADMLNVQIRSAANINFKLIVQILNDLQQGRQ